MVLEYITTKSFIEFYTARHSCYEYAGRNMLIISIVDKNRLHDFFWLSTLIDFNRQISEIQKNMYGGIS